MAGGDWVDCCELLRQRGDAREEGFICLERRIRTLPLPSWAQSFPAEAIADARQTALILAVEGVDDGRARECRTFRGFVIGCWWTALHIETAWYYRVTEAGDDEATPPASPEPDPAELAEQEEQRGRFWQAWQHCYDAATSAQRRYLDVVKLRFFDELEWPTIAEQLNITVNNAQVRCTRGLIYLAACFAAQFRNGRH